MPRRSYARVLCLAVGLICGGSVLAAPPTDEQVDAAAKQFTTKIAEARADKNTPVNAKITTDIADAALEPIDVSGLTVAQIATLQKSIPLALAGKAPAISTRLGELAKDQGVTGAEAAATRLTFLRLEKDPAAQAEIVRTALKHPALGAALKEGKAINVFGGLRSANPAALQTVLPDILALDKVISTDMAPAAAASAASLMDVLLTLTKEDETAVREPLRVKLLAAVREAAKKTPATDERLTTSLTRAEAKLDGAFMKGQLLNHEAPAIDFIWTNMNPPVKSLADLKGKVVVLDFWATWCGPCVGSFPDVKKLQARYEGYPVEIIGVTSIQGKHYPKGKDPIDCKDDPKKEMDLMTGYTKDMDMTWKVAFSKQEVFNPEYGINGIPHVAIVDTKGVIRFRGLHPNSKYTPFQDKTDKIDALLKEAGLPVPPPEKPEDKPEAPKGG